MATECAFPTTESRRFVSGGPLEPVSVGGLSKREYFAARALQGFIAANPQCEAPGGHAPHIYAKGAVTMADALIAELEKGEKG